MGRPWIKSVRVCESVLEWERGKGGTECADGIWPGLFPASGRGRSNGEEAGGEAGRRGGVGPFT